MENKESTTEHHSEHHMEHHTEHHTKSPKKQGMDMRYIAGAIIVVVVIAGLYAAFALGKHSTGTTASTTIKSITAGGVTSTIGTSSPTSPSYTLPQPNATNIAEKAQAEQILSNLTAPTSNIVALTAKYNQTENVTSPQYGTTTENFTILYEKQGNSIAVETTSQPNLVYNTSMHIINYDLNGTSYYNCLSGGLLYPGNTTNSSKIFCEMSTQNNAYVFNFSTFLPRNYTISKLQTSNAVYGNFSCKSISANFASYSIIPEQTGNITVVDSGLFSLCISSQYRIPVQFSLNMSETPYLQGSPYQNQSIKIRLDNILGSVSNNASSSFVYNLPQNAVMVNSTQTP